MIALATIPPLWRRVMDHRVLALYDGDVTRANLHPRRSGIGCWPATAGADRTRHTPGTPPARRSLAVVAGGGPGR